MQFEQQTITLRSSTGDKEGKPVLATVALGTGLAYCPIAEDGRAFDVIHIASGFRLGGFFYTEQEVLSFLELVLPLADWTQNQEALMLHAISQPLLAARKKVLQMRDDTLKSLLSPSIVKALEEKMLLSGFTLQELVENAIDMYLDEDEEDQSFLGQVEQELHRACLKHPSLHSLHEAYAVILEEVDELKAEVWKKDEARDYEAIRSELVQIAAMCARTENDLL
jgi:hypothetical protein